MQKPFKELPSVGRPLERIGIDLTDMIAGSKGYRYVLSVVDHFSRYVKFYPLKSKNTQGVIEALAQYVTDFGASHSIVLDNGGEFTSQTFQQFCQQHLITLYYTTPYHPQGNVIPERLHRTLKTMLGHPMPRTSSSMAQIIANIPSYHECCGPHQYGPTTLLCVLFETSTTSSGYEVAYYNR